MNYFVNKKTLAIALTGFLLFPSGCTKDSNDSEGGRPDRGIQVGNSRLATFYSPQYKFRVSYDTRITFELFSDQEFKFSNSVFLKSGMPESSSYFRVFPEGKVENETIDNLELLRRHVKEKHPGENFDPVKLGTTPGFFYQNKNSDTRIEATYYLLTPRGDVVNISVNAFEEGLGIAYVLPIVESFVYDDTSPTLNSIELEGTPQLRPGSLVRFKIRTHDSLSGIRNQVQISLAPISSVTSGPTGSHGGFFQVIESLTFLREDEYLVEFTIPPAMQAGEYEVRRVRIWDRVGNRTTAVFRTLDGSMPEISIGEVEGPGTAICLTISPVTPTENHKPVIHEIRLSSYELIAGTSATVVTRVTLESVNSPQFQAWLDIRSIQKPDDPIPSLQIATRAIPLGNDWFAIKFDVGIYLEAGKYFIRSLDLAASNGERTNLTAGPADALYSSPTQPLAVLRFDLKNEGVSDNKPPLVDQIKFEKSEIVVGNTETILFHAIDSISGIADFIGFAGKLSADFKPKEISKSKVSFGGSVKHLPGDWYSIEFRIPEDSEAGTYFLQALLVADKAGNTQRVALPQVIKERPIPSTTQYENEGGERFPVIKFQVLPKEMRMPH